VRKKTTPSSDRRVVGRRWGSERDAAIPVSGGQVSWSSTPASDTAGEWCSGCQRKHPAFVDCVDPPERTVLDYARVHAASAALREAAQIVATRPRYLQNAAIRSLLVPAITAYDEAMKGRSDAVHTTGLVL